MIEHLQEIDGDCLFNLIKLEQEIAELDESSHLDRQTNCFMQQALIHYTFAQIIDTIGKIDARDLSASYNLVFVN